jgi:predicted DNA-binding protein
MRIPVEHAEAMRAMSQKTRVPIAEYQREAIEDWLKKHDALPVAPGDEGDTRGGA